MSNTTKPAAIKNKAPNVQTAHTQTPTKSINWLAILAMMISILALLLCGMVAYQQFLAHAREINISQQLSKHAQTWQTVQHQLDKQQRQQQAQDESIKSIHHLLGQHKIDWLLLNMAQQLQIANTSLVFTQNTRAVVHLLSQFDDDIQQLKDTRLSKLHQALQQDIKHLQQINSSHIPKILTSLMQLQHDVRQLNFPGKPLLETVTHTQTAAIPTQTTLWQKIWKKSLAILQSLVVIRHHEEPIQPLTLPLEQLVLRQNLQITLEQAKWAAMHHYHDSYQTSLKQARAWLVRYFLQDQNTTKVQATLKQLMSISVKTPIPNLKQTQAALQQLLQQTT